MAGTNELDSQQPDSDCAFEWDETSQLYFHSSTGFYYNPEAGWYYSSRDGLYYKFEDGNYVLLGSSSDGGDQHEKFHDSVDMDSNKLLKDKQRSCVDGFGDDDFLAETERIVADETSKVDSECDDNHPTEDPRPPSEWVEDTLINLFLSGYPSQGGSTASNAMQPMGTNDIDTSRVPADGAGDSDTYELEEGEWIPEDRPSIDSTGKMTDEVISWEEENWRAQYGQVTEQNQASVLDIQAIDLWDWEMVKETTKSRKNGVYKLVGRLVKCSNKLHPSLASSGCRLKTAAICEVRLDLVKVRSGQVYRLRTPSRKYLASLSTYDSSNPTGDWGFPDFSIDNMPHPVERFEGHNVYKEECSSLEHSNALKQEKKKVVYRDRAAERRALHGGFGVGPGQKKSSSDVGSSPSSPTLASQEEAAAESMNISFGEGSYARKLLKGMGWKEGEALGKSTKGVVEPLKAIGNKGNAGLGWNRSK